MSRLTDRTFVTGVSTTDLIHIVVTGDTSQSSDGSSYKASIQQVIDLITGTTGTSGTSGTNGSSGTNGTSGTNGSSGTSGTNGTNGTSPSFFYGTFISKSAQTSTSTTTAYSMSADTTIYSNGVSVVNGSQFTVANYGIYNIQFSAQLESSSGGSTQTMDILVIIS